MTHIRKINELVGTSGSDPKCWNLINLLLDAIDHAYLQTDGRYGDLAMEVVDKVEYLKKLRSKGRVIDEMNNNRISDDGLSFYVPIQPIQDMKELRIEVTYESGSGVFVYVNPVTRDEYGVGWTASPDIRVRGFKVFVKSAGRKNMKYMLSLASRIGPVAEDIGGLYNDGKYEEIESMVKRLA